MSLPLAKWAAVAALIAAVASSAADAQRRAFTPVTDEMLGRPAAADWLHWRGTSASWGYSPLDQINRDNVGQLQLAWAWQMEPGNQQAAPLVHDGVMFLPNPSGILQALDAETGDLLWEYRHELPDTIKRRGSPLRGLSLYEDKVYLNTVDARIVALDARDGRVVWNVQAADPKLGFTYLAGSIVARGKVISGLQGCDRFYQEKCAITAHDARTGKEMWRVATIAKPGEPHGDSWGDVPLMFRAGTDMWIPGSYDPELNLVYWSTSQAKPWTRAARGTEGDALYSNSTLAINPDTGKVEWFYQFVPGETLDMDEVFENILVDIGPRKSLFKMGKLGILWEIDRRTGKFVRATDLRYQNILRVESNSGQVNYLPNMVPALNKEFDMCPSFGGVKSWRAMAYTPETSAFYIPAQLTCQKVVFLDVKKEEGSGGAGMGRRDNYHHPASGENLGEFIAMSASGEILWKHRQRAPFNTAALTTAGGLVFVGDWNRYVNAYDVKTGQLLWQTRGNTSAQGFPISYAVNGRQYIAVPMGVGALSWGTDIPLKLVPEIKRPSSGNAMFVFALPQTGSKPATSAATTVTGTAPSRGGAPAPAPTAAVPATAPPATTSVWNGVFAREQAATGKGAYGTYCSGCHQSDLTGSGPVPALGGEAFLVQTDGRTVNDLFTRIRTTMPPDAPGSLPAKTYVDITAYLLEANGFPAGARTLSADADALSRVRITRKKN